MKYLNFILTLLVICLIALSCIIYFKPTPNRYLFTTIPYKEWVVDQTAGYLSGYTVQDTAMGKIYEWSTFSLGDEISSEKQSIIIKDPVNNKIVWKFPKGQIERNNFLKGIKEGTINSKQRNAYKKQLLK